MDDSELVYKIGSLFTKLLKANASGKFDGEHTIVANGVTLQVYIRGMELAFCPIPDGENKFDVKVGANDPQ